jgi:hypothetical protein
VKNWARPCTLRVEGLEIGPRRRLCEAGCAPTDLPFPDRLNRIKIRRV